METKYCKDCGEERPVSEFGSNGYHGLRSICREHVNERNGRRRALLTPSGLCIRCCSRNKLPSIKKCLFCYLADKINKGAAGERNLRAGRTRREGSGANEALCRSRTGAIKAYARMGIGLWRRSGGVCLYTGDRLIPGVNVALDHIIPLTRGGTNETSNLQLISARANAAKGDMTHDEYVEHCRLVAKRMDALAGYEEYHAFIKVA
jgi:hypothetical protein